MYEPFIDPSGPSLGSVIVYMRYENSEGELVLQPVWSLKNHQGPNWMYGQANLKNENDFVVRKCSFFPFLLYSLYLVLFFLILCTLLLLPSFLLHFALHCLLIFNAFSLFPQLFFHFLLPFYFVSWFFLVFAISSHLLYPLLPWFSCHAVFIIWFLLFSFNMFYPTLIFCLCLLLPNSLSFHLAFPLLYHFCFYFLLSCHILCQYSF